MEADRKERERLLEEIDRLTHQIQRLEKGLDEPDRVLKNTHRQKEENIKEEHESIRSILNTPFEGIAIHDNCIIVDVNDTLLSLLGYSRSEVIGACTMDFISEASRQGIRENIAKGMEKPQEVVLVRKDGKPLDIEFSSDPASSWGDISG